MLTNTPCAKLHPHVQDWLGPIVTLDGPPCGSGAYRLTRCYQNLAPNSVMQTKFNTLPAPTLTINTRLKQAGFLHWKTHPTLPSHTSPTTKHVPYELLPQIAIPKINSRPNSPVCRVQAGIPGTSLLYYKDKLLEPNATIREILMGFQPGTTTAPVYQKRIDVKY